ncbi:MAG: response regulator [Nitrospira sp.]
MKDTLKPTLLVIDDDPAVRGLFQTALESAGYRVLIAESGQHSLNLLSHCTVDVILADSLMPGGDGLELIPRLRVAQPNSKIIALSGGAAEGDGPNEMKPLGADDILKKPCSFYALLDAITAQLKPVARK